MGVSAPVAGKANGLSTVVDTIASPAEAFERQRMAPTWGWALVVAMVLLLIGTFLQAPAAHHATMGQMQHMFAGKFGASLSDAQKQKIIQNAGKPSVFTYIGPVFVLFLAVTFNTLFMLIGNAVGRGQSDFKRLWCGSMNIAVPTLGLGAVVMGLVTMLRGADTFNSSIDLARAMPSLAMIVPHASAVLTTFLSGISIFTLWGFFLNATMLRVMAKASAGAAYAMAAVVLLLGALVPAGAAALAHNAGFM